MGEGVASLYRQYILRVRGLVNDVKNDPTCLEPTTTNLAQGKGGLEISLVTLHFSAKPSNRRPTFFDFSRCSVLVVAGALDVLEL